MNNDSFDLGDFLPPDLDPEPVTPTLVPEYTPAQGRGEPASACYVCGGEFRSWTGSVTIRDFLTLCRQCLHFLDTRVK